MQKAQGSMRRWHGSKALIFDAIEETTNLVERMHVSAANRSVKPMKETGILATPAGKVHAIHSATAGAVYAAVRRTSRGVESILDAGAQSFTSFDTLVENLGGQIHQSTPQRSDAAGSSSWYLDHVEAHINGFYGDYLAHRQNSLDLGMSLRVDGIALPMQQPVIERAIPDASNRICVFVHGLCCTEWAWSIAAEEFYNDPGTTMGSLLQDEGDYTPLYVRYNSGRHISENGRALSTLLADLMAVYPCEVDEIVLIGHSMGGLVARSAAYYGRKENEAWSTKLKTVCCIGAPTLGAPLEQAVGLVGGLLSTIDLVGTQVPAQLLNARSAGIKDLRHGYTVDEEWIDKNQNAPLSNHRLTIPLVDGVGYYFVASTVTENPGHPVSLLLGDLMVRLPSATGQSARSERSVEFHAGGALNGISHFHLADHPAAYAVIRELLIEESHH